MKQSKLAAAAAACLFFSGLSAGALEIVSAVPVKTEKGTRADFIFNSSMTVKKIAFEKGAVVMPVTESNDRIYSDIKLLSKVLYQKIENCLSKNKCAPAAKPATPMVSLVEVKTLKSKTRVANVTLAFDKELSVTFGAIKKASGEMWAAYPENFEVQDETLKGLIEKKVVESLKPAAAPEKKPSAPAEPKK